MSGGAVSLKKKVASNPLLIKDKNELLRRMHAFENAIFGYRAGFQDQSASIFVFFFFKQKTAYEILRSDWSSDVCSSDLWPRSQATSAAKASLRVANGP